MKLHSLLLGGAILPKPCVCPQEALNRPRTRLLPLWRLLLTRDYHIVSLLELAFSTKSVRELCENQARARQRLGERVAEKLKRRLADMRAVYSVIELVAGRPHELEGAHSGEFAVDLSGDSRILFCANHNVVPRLESGRVNWAKVSRIKIIKIEYDQT